MLKFTNCIVYDELADRVSNEEVSVPLVTDKATDTYLHGGSTSGDNEFKQGFAEKT